MLEPSALHPLILSFTPLISYAKACLLHTPFSSALLLQVCFKADRTVIVGTQISPLPRTGFIREGTAYVGCISVLRK